MSRPGDLSALCSPNFSLAEMSASDAAVRHGIDNHPPVGVQHNLHRLCAVLEQVRALVGQPIIVTSGYRCLAVNRKVGSADSSYHVKGLAADIRAASLTPRQLATRIRDADLAFDQLILEFDSWVHIGLAETWPMQRRQVLTASIQRGRTQYQPGIV